MMKTIITILLLFLNLPLWTQSNERKEMREEKVKIEIWSDVVCPFCFIGKKKMEKAIAKYKAEDKVEIIWRSFQLDPNFPENSSAPYYEYLSKRKGIPVEQVQGMSAHLIANGKNYGIDYQFSKLLVFNTLDVHRLIKWAATLGRSNELKEAFMFAYFTEGLDMSKEENILAAVEKIGLDIDEARKLLQSDAYLKNVQEDIHKARTIGIRGVPFFLVNGKDAIYGAQDDKVFDNAVASALKNVKVTTNGTDDGICLPDTECEVK